MYLGAKSRSGCRFSGVGGWLCVPSPFPGSSWAPSLPFVLALFPYQGKFLQFSQKGLKINHNIGQVSFVLFQRVKFAHCAVLRSGVSGGGVWLHGQDKDLYFQLCCLFWFCLASSCPLMFYSSFAVSVGSGRNRQPRCRQLRCESSGAWAESRGPVSTPVSCALAGEAALDNTVTHPCPDSVPGVTHRAGWWSRGSLGSSVSRTGRVSSLAQNLLVLPSRRACFCHLRLELVLVLAHGAGTHPLLAQCS